MSGLRPVGQSLSVNLALAASVTLAFLGGLEGLSRWQEGAPPSVDEDIVGIWSWEKEWHGEFYSLGKGSLGWPPPAHINRDGFRDQSRPRPKAEGLTRVICLGDSVTFGDGLGPGKAYPQVMEALLQDRGYRVEVFNLALPGWSTRQERIAFREIARPYRPDQVLLGVCLNDLAELQNNLSRPPSWLADLHQRSALVRWLVDARGREIRSVEELFKEPASARVRAAYERFFVELRLLRDEVRASGASFALALFPYRFQVAAAAAALPVAQRRILGFCASERLQCLDLLPALRASGAAAFRDANHFSAGGSRQVAQALVDDLWSAPGPSADELLEPWRGRWLSALREGSPAVRAAAAWHMSRQPELVSPEVVEALRGGLVDEHESVRIACLRAFAALGPKLAAEAAASLAMRLSDDSQPVRWEAAQSLWRTRAPVERVLPFLIRALESSDEYVRSYAVWSLGEAGPAAESAVPGLVAALRWPEAWGPAGSALALGKIGPGASESVPVLIPYLVGSDPSVRARAAQVLGLIGPRAQAAEAALVARIADEDETVRFQSVRALGRIGASDATTRKALEAATHDDGERVRAEAAAALAVAR